MSFMDAYEHDPNDDNGKTGGLDILKPEPRNVNNNVLDFISKYKADLQYLKNGKMSIERYLAESGLSDEETDKKLAKLDKAIKSLEKLIKEFENNK